DLARQLDEARVLYTPHSPAEGPAAYRDELLGAAQQIEADTWDGRRSRESHLRELLRDRRPTLELRDLSPLLDSLRIIKSSREVELMRRAGRITALAVREAMRSTRPGLREYQLGAVADYVFRVNGGRGAAYRAIIASGPNIWLPHYWRNDQELRDGELVLMDYAPDYHYYTSDIGRTWPVRGRFTDEQWEQYRFITRYHQELLKRIRPGALPSEILAEAASEMHKVIEHTRFMNAAFEAAARRSLTFSGHLSHPVGIAVHDVGRYYDRPLEPGVVFSVDPQLWAPEEKLYVRVEDTVVVTADGMENLTALAPVELDDIEIEIARPSMLAAYPPVFIDEEPQA
ncbi:MAG: M24 family metallopeptidase, partial [Chloroflexi bacterium]|nr:M24 family metallopeptidase [Chloroflexota bacterium]